MMAQDSNVADERFKQEKIREKRHWRTRRVDNVKFWLERVVLSGTWGRVGLMAGGVAALSFVAALLVVNLEEHQNFFEAWWWAFLRLTDSGYLGDDKGNFRRVVSTVLTVSGLAIFVGGVVAIMTQWLNETVRKLERGLTPVSISGHVVVLGWTDRTVTIVRELVRSQGNRPRFRRPFSRHKLAIVVLADDVDSSLLHEFRTQMGKDWDAGTITLRSGSPLRNEHLERVGFLRASTIVLPGADFGAGGPEAVDTRTIKTILAINMAASNVDEIDRPTLIAEIYDSRKIAIARRAYDGPIEVLASDQITSSLIAQNTRHANLSYIYRELLDQDGNELYVRRCPEFIGWRVHEVRTHFKDAIVIGTVRQEGLRWVTRLCQGFDGMIEELDHLVLICEDYESSAPISVSDMVRADVPEEMLSYEEKAPEVRKILVLGWGHMLPALLQEFERFERQHHEVHVFSMQSMTQRKRQMKSHAHDFERVTLVHHEGDYTVLSELASVEPWTFDYVIVLASDWIDSSEEADARNIVGFLLLGELCDRAMERGTISRAPDILVELTDESNEELLSNYDVEVVVSAELEGHMLAQVTLRQELHAVFLSLFGALSPMFDFRPASTYEQVVGEELSFAALQWRALQYGEVLVGVRLDPEVRDGRHERESVVLNPGRESLWRLGRRDDLIVLVH